ncbi:methyl-accepting chemotaxis protein [Desulfobacterales bacterium HSG2]|nr:methyl-accepting chemotaxis protein [Desulfobacterales bacterium HSG2]
MLQFFRKSVMRWLVAFFVSGALISIAMVAGLAFYYSKLSLREAAFRQLSVVNETRKNQILSYIKERMANVKMFSESWGIVKAFSVLQLYHDSGGAGLNGRFDVTSEEYGDIYKEIDPFFRKYLEAFQYQDIYFICKTHGHVMYSAEQEQYLGVSLISGTYKDSELAKLWAKIIKEKKAGMTDFETYPSEDRTAAFIGAPVFDQKEDMYAVIIAEISPEQIMRMLKKGIWKTEESCFAGRDFLICAHPISSDSQPPLKNKAGSVELKDKTSVKVTENYRGVKVLSSYSHIGMNEELGTDFEWAVISEIEEAEAFAPVRSLGFRLFWLGVILTVFACVAGYFTGRSIAIPLGELCDKVALITDGDLTLTIQTGHRIDEIGTLTDAFLCMVRTLRDQTREIREGAHTIASSISQISTTAAQLAANSAETSTSVSEITSTVEDVRRITYIANEKSEEVAEGANQASRIYDAGKKATEEAVFGMNRIREEMEYVAESIIRLSEQTQSIGEIISAVNDLAEQSNLLSVNASIEAAKAGEHGKGFAVVAQEVKSLADQSKEATNQVRAILNDIQKATGTAVMATERGSKAVEAGVRLSGESGDSIDRLSDSVMSSKQAAIRIAASSQDQLSGMDQLLQAMESIEEASMQNVDGARQLETAARSLDELAQNLKDLASKFKI